MSDFDQESYDEDAAWAGSDSDWRGEAHLEEWPADLAGPEYRMFREAREAEEDRAAEARAMHDAIDALLRSL